MGIDFPCEVETGGIVGAVELVGCVQGHDSPWAIDGCYHWLLKKARSVPFVPMPGRLGIFNVEVPARSGRTHASSKLMGEAARGPTKV